MDLPGKKSYEQNALEDNVVSGKERSQTVYFSDKSLTSCS
jgi:hypothetical protein